MHAARLKRAVDISLARLPAVTALGRGAKAQREVSGQCWPPTAWPKAVKLVAAGALSAAISTAAVAPLEQLRLKLIVGTYGTSSRRLEKTYSTLSRGPSAGAILSPELISSPHRIVFVPDQPASDPDRPSHRCRDPGRSIPEVISKTLALHGPAGFFKGNMMSVVRTVPSKGVQFAACAPPPPLLPPTTSPSVTKDSPGAVRA